MVVQFRNEKVSNHGSTPITIDCNVVALIVFEEGFHQAIKRTKHPLEKVNTPLRFLTLVEAPEAWGPHIIDMAVKLSSDLFSVWFGNSSNDHQARRRFVEWAQNEIAVVPNFHMRILFSYEAHLWLNGYVNKQNCRIWSEANPQVYVETPLHPEKLTVWCALWAGGILLQKR
ncbi:hypothetical protein TNCV_4718181 [Trichonephila clavipes]|nr:hypothetical protein TNCV_4718181 [Trichonephila clavipes]